MPNKSRDIAMILSDVLKKAEKFTIDNSPLILTAFGVTGVVATAVLTGKATFKAAEVIAVHDFDGRYDETDTNKELNKKEKVALVWKLYIPPVATGATTITCIIFANRIGTARAAALAAAYSISEKAFVEYKEKVLEKIGLKEETKVRDELAQERVNRNQPIDKQIIITGNGDVLCLDSLTGRYFKSQMETIKKAQNDTNHQLINQNYASLTDFYDRIGLPGTPYSEEVGWNVDVMMEIMFSTTLTEAQEPCIVLEYNTVPIRGYNRLS